MGRLLSGAEIGRLAGVDKSTVSRCKDLKAAKRGNGYDPDHPAVLAFVKARARKKPGKSSAVPAARPSVAPITPPSGDYDLTAIPENIQEYADKPLSELAVLFATDAGFKGWLDGIKKIEDIREKRLKNDEREGQVVAFTLVQKGILDPVEAFLTRLHTDTRKRLAIECHEASKAGAGVEELEAIMADQFESAASALKHTVARGVKSAIE